MMDSSQLSEALAGVDKDKLIEKVKEEIAVAHAQELFTKITEKCFKMCIIKPGTSVSNSEQKCITMCMDRYIDSFNIISRTYSNRLQQEHHRM